MRGRDHRERRPPQEPGGRLDEATAVAQEAAATGQSVHDVVLCSGLLNKERLDEILSPEALAGVPPQTDPPDPDR
jgi:aspartate ammonia-lyase